MNHLVLGLWVWGAGCGAHRLESTAGGAGENRDAGLSLPPISEPRAPSSAEQCAEEAIRGELFPLDLLLLLDASGSMNFRVGERTRWQLVSQALVGFLGDPRSRGLGVGFQTFPFTVYEKVCTSDADCSGAPGDCSRPFLCAGPGVLPAVARICDPGNPICPEAGTQCVPSGRCSGTSARCVSLGELCPGGGANDRCDEAPLVCKLPIDSCTPGDYERPKVPIAILPEATAALTAGLAGVRPQGNTPIAPAVEGATRYLRQHLAAHPERRAALVLASDASPTGCGPNDLETTLVAIESARGGSPSLSTYVIAAVSPGDRIGGLDANRLAQAGGSSTPIVLNDSAPDLGERFLEALNAIRGSALPCEFRIPRPSTGMIDYGRVNVRYVAAGGTEDLAYVRSADRCGPITGGWYYDVDPATSTPSSVRVCEGTCRRFKADATGMVELRFGCRTRID